MRPLILSIVLLFSGVVFSQVPVDSGYVEVKGAKIFYQIFGEGSPVLFINGGPGYSSEGYKHYAELLSDTFQVILFDMRGTGRSVVEKKGSYGKVKEMVEDLEHLRNHLQLDTWYVFGHSFGGQYALQYVARHPKRIDKLVLSATPNLIKKNVKNAIQWYHTPDLERMTKPELLMLQKIQEEHEKSNPNLDSLVLFNRALKARKYVQNPENYKKVMDWFLENQTQGSFSLGFSIGDYKILRRLKKFKNPVLIVHGVNDFINIKSPQLYDKIFSNSTLKFFENSGHMIIFDQPNEYKNILNEFLLKD